MATTAATAAATTAAAAAALQQQQQQHQQQRESVKLVTDLVVIIFSIHLSLTHPRPTLPPHYYEQLLMADRLSLRLVRPSKMDEAQSEKLSAATGQPGRLDQFIRQLRLFSAALAAFVLAANGRESPSLSLSLSLSVCLPFPLCPVRV